MVKKASRVWRAAKHKLLDTEEKTDLEVQVIVMVLWEHKEQEQEKSARSQGERCQMDMEREVHNGVVCQTCKTKCRVCKWL